MQEATADNETLFETVVFLNHLSDLPDPRRDWLKIGGIGARRLFLAPVV
jgi:hypothetical protein